MSKLIQPVQSAEELLQDIESTRSSPSGFRVWWLGQSGFLIQYQGRHLLFDPYLSDSLTLKYAATDKPHVRMTERVIAPEALTHIDVVTSTHNHTDHLDADTLVPLRRVNPDLVLVLPEANRAFASNRLGSDLKWARGLNAGEQIEIKGFHFHGVPAAHNEIEINEEGQHKFMGYVVSFGPYTVYHSGDTLWYEGMEDMLMKYSIDLALLPINGNKPERRVAGNLNAREAAQLANKIGARQVIPCHYEMFAFNTASTVPFIDECTRLGQPFTVLRAAESKAIT